MRATLQVAEYCFILIIILTTSIQSQQYPCSCSCCIGVNCQPVPFPNINAFYCSSDSCLQACSSQYYQCQRTPPNGQAIAQCLTLATGPYSCQCNCCNSGSASCTPAFVGSTTAYSCDSSSCSIACATQYAGVCISNQYGQTQSTCSGLTTTSTATTVSTSSLGNACSCYCCRTGPNCLPISNVGNTSSLQCSTLACTQACQVGYPTLCPASLIVGQTKGLCSNPASGNTRCQCNCCGGNGCFNYNLYTNAGCSSCSILCQQQTQCINSNPGTYTCSSNSTALSQFPSFNWNLFLFLSSSHLFNLFEQ
jgi:hypothetical protein